MKAKTICKRVLDILVTIGLLFTMGYQLWGEVTHEWVGAGMFVLFTAHHILNLNWYKSLFKGRYTPMRILQFSINMMTLVSMLALMYSGIALSHHVFVFLPIENGLALARRLHILGSYWGLVLMSLHLGLHWNMVLGLLRKNLIVKSDSKARSIICFLMGSVIAGYGVFVVIKRDFLTYMLLKSEFVFLDYGEPKILFYMDYLALMGLCIFAAYYVSNLLRKIYDLKEVHR